MSDFSYTLVDVLQEAKDIAASTTPESVTAKQVGDLIVRLVENIANRPFVEGFYFVKTETEEGRKDVLTLSVGYELFSASGAVAWSQKLVPLPFASPTASGVMTADQAAKLESLGSEADTINHINANIKRMEDALNDRIAAVEIQLSTLSALLKTEETARAAADASLQNQINKEETDRMVADNNLRRRVQGDMEVANATTDPFVKIETLSLAETNEILDRLANELTTDNLNGHLRFSINDSTRWLYVLNRIDSEQSNRQGVTQVAFGWITTDDACTTLLAASPDQTAPRILTRRRLKNLTAAGPWMELSAAFEALHSLLLTGDLPY